MAYVQEKVAILAKAAGAAGPRRVPPVAMGYDMHFGKPNCITITLPQLRG